MGDADWKSGVRGDAPISFEDRHGKTRTATLGELLNEFGVQANKPEGAKQGESTDKFVVQRARALLKQLNEYLDITDFDAAAQWAQDHGKADYMFSKQAICAYVAREAMSFLKQGIRINAICPGPTDTPLAQANKEMWLGFGSDYRALVGVEAATPLEQAYPLVFLCSDAAAAITGTTMITDSGYFSAGMTESFPDAKPVVDFLLGRY
jgi:NAD(P)-dependent dehydrogenase (short-subunit alcohol dehydrogenase family)